MTLARRLAVLLLPALLAAAPAVARGDATDPAGPPALTDSEKAVLERVETYWNGIRTLRARFLQESPEGLVQGTVYLRKPGHMRVAYDPPTRILIVANGRHLIYHDAAVDQVSYLDPAETPLGLLLEETIAFSDPAVTVTAVEETPEQVAVTAVQAADPGSGSLTLVFATDPLRFHQWRVRDAQGTETVVTLEHLQTGVTLSAALFRFRPPKRSGRDD